jgi:hypothetical protein
VLGCLQLRESANMSNTNIFVKSFNIDIKRRRILYNFEYVENVEKFTWEKINPRKIMEKLELF